MTSGGSVRQLLAGRDFAGTDPLASQMANFAYALVDSASRQALLVDPAYAPLELAGQLELDGITLAGVVLTHYHPDHAGGRFAGFALAGIAELLAAHDVPVHVQAAETAFVLETTGVDASCLVAHDGGDELRLGETEVTLVHTPGHTPGSQCLLLDGALVTGDTLFLDGCGRTDLPGGDAAALYDSLFHRLAILGGDTLVLPGHAYSPEPSASLAEVRRRNPVLALASEDDFVSRLGS